MAGDLKDLKKLLDNAGRQSAMAERATVGKKKLRQVQKELKVASRVPPKAPLPKGPNESVPTNVRQSATEKTHRPRPMRVPSQRRAPKEANLTPVRNAPPKLELNEDLPVSERAQEIAEAIKNHQVVIVAGETGSGKTTQLPKICLQLGRGKQALIGHTQPRRIAASSIARRISEEMGAELGQVAGFKVRFRDAISPGASIKLMTDGILLSETQHDRLLKAYDTIIIDEAHERSLNIDFLLGYLKEILPRRKDLKVIITSATIDSERFAKHFADKAGHPAPVINVSGRLYPVEIRYQPIENADENDDRTLMDGVREACEDLMVHGRGDILVFLPGEREINEAYEALGGLATKGVELLKLYSRLSAEDQERIFSPGGARRIVLSTNIAETSLTVPGIRYVVDTGLARVKRYSYRNKVEQLHSEPISQAAAAQRAGRCGRVADGICIRLYSQEDFERRPQYTDPEILRSSLATVILRMKTLQLTDVREFPFVEPPPSRAISDGYDLLVELNAVNARGGELTAVGRQLARLPLDARVARILQAGHENQALSEMLVVASALSVQDPRERPLEAQEQAAAAHRKFRSDKSDFLSWLNLWNSVQERFENKESNRALERQLRADYLSVRRVREWRDVWRQLKELVAEMGWRVNTAPATYEQVHKALLAGLLGNVGNRSPSADFRAAPFLGARGIRFWPWPGSALAKKAGKWILAAEIVETSRLFARTIGNIEPEWVEQVGAHLIKKSWSEPRWEKNAGRVMALEKGTLYGLPVYSGRRVDYSQKDPKTARELFIREALVQGDFNSQAPFWQHNLALIRDIEEMEHKSRRPDVLVDEQRIFDFYDGKIPADVCSASELDKWRSTVEKENPKLLYLTKQDLMRHDASGITIEYFPKKMEINGVPMAVSYNFDPGSPRDGVTLTVPLYALNMISEAAMEWLVPGMVREKTFALIKGLPQKLRRHFVPLPEWAKAFATSHERPSGSLIETIISQARQDFSIDIRRTDFKLENLAAHLFMNYKVVDEQGRQLAMSRSLPELRSELSAQARQTFQTIAAKDATISADLPEEVTDWNFGDLPELMEIRRKGVSMIGIPAVCDHGQYCSVEVFDDPEQAEREHRKGLRRLIALRLKEQIKYLDKNLSSLQSVQIQSSTLGFMKKAFPGLEELKQDVINAAIDQIAFTEKLPNSQKEFEAICETVRGKLNLIALEISRLLSQIVSEAVLVNQKLNGVKAFSQVQDDINQQMGELFAKGFLVKTPMEQLRHYPRYLKAVVARLTKLKVDPARDAERMRQIQQLTTPYLRKLAERKGVRDARLEQFAQQLQELRVSLFAQELKTPMPVSVKRLTRNWEAILRGQ